MPHAGRALSLSTALTAYTNTTNLIHAPGPKARYHNHNSANHSADLGQNKGLCYHHCYALTAPHGQLLSHIPSPCGRHSTTGKYDQKVDGHSHLATTVVAIHTHTHTHTHNERLV